MDFTRKMKLRELKGIICNRCFVSIRKPGIGPKYENFRIPFSKALSEFGDYTVWFIYPYSDDMLDIVITEEEP